MRNLRTFSQEFKRQVVEELMSGESRSAQLRRRHNISPSLLYHWKKHSLGKFNNEPIEEAALKDRIEKLERLVGRLTLESEFLRKRLQHNLNQSRRNENSSANGNVSSAVSGKDAK